METQIIEDVQAYQKGIKITFTNGKEFFLSVNAYTDGFFYPGKELTKQEYLDIKLADKNKKANDYLCYLISYSRYTYQQLFNKIKSKYRLPKKEIDNLLHPYLEAGIINDLSYAQDFIESKISSGYGKKFILSQLKERGISETELNKAEIQSLFLQSNNQLDNLIKKIDKGKSSQTIEKRKETIFATLLRRGFQPSESKEAIESYFSSFSDVDKESESEKRKLLLSSEAEKCYNSIRHQSKDSSKKKDSFIQKLIRKGFTYDEIMSVISIKEYTFND